MVIYLDLNGFRTRTLMPVSDVDYVEQDSPGYVAARIAVRTSFIHSRLRKRYGKSLPFSAPFPETILDWLVRMVTWDVLRKRGVNPQDPMGAEYKADEQRALDELKEAADSKEGLFDLPNPEEGASNVTTGGPLGYSETSPYVGARQEALQGRAEDAGSRTGFIGPFGTGDS